MATLAEGTTIGGIDVIAELRRLAAGSGGSIGGATSVASADRADVAIKLMTARSIRVNLNSSAAAEFDGTANITPGITGILPKENGGTGNNKGVVDQLSVARTFSVNLAKTDNANFDGTANVELGVTGVLPIEKGGTGTTTGVPSSAESAGKLTTPVQLSVDFSALGTALFDGSSNLKIPIGTIPLPILFGGTGQTTMEGTDYNTLRYRAIAFTQGTPDAGPVNGGMIFTYA